MGEVTDVIDIDFNRTGQSIYYDVPEGRPSVVSDIQVWADIDSDEIAEEVATGAPSIDSVNTTFDVASGVTQPDQTKCALTATTNIVAGRRYLAINAYGQREWVEVERIYSADSVYNRVPLVHDYAVNDTFQGTRLSATIDADWVADEDNLSDPRNPRPRWRAVWTYTVSSVTYRETTFFNLTRYPFRLAINAHDVDRLSRGWLSRLHPDDTRGAGNEIINEASKQVRLDLWEHELTDSAFRNNSVINELIRWRSVWLVADAAFFQGGVGADQVELSRRRYYERLDNLVRQPKSNVQVNDEGATAVHQSSPIWRR